MLLVAALSTAAAVPGAQSLDFDRSVEKLFAPDDPLLRPYEKLKRTFGGNEIVLAVYEAPDLLDPDGRGIERLAGIAERLKAVPGVKDVISLDQPLGKLVVNDLASVVAGPIRRMLEGYTHGPDGRIASVVCILWPEAETDVARQATIDDLRAVAAELPSGMIAGEPVMVADGFAYVEDDGWRLTIWTSVLLSVVILAAFRSLRWVIIAIAVVQVSLLWTKALLAVSGLELSMVSSMLSAIVTVVGIAVVIHVIVRFRDARAEGLPTRGALEHTIALLMRPVFWSVATTAAGFAALLAASVSPVRDFGLMMALGAAMVLVAVVLVVPGLALMGRSGADPRRAWGEGLLDRLLDRAARAAQQRPAVVAAAGAVVAGAAIVGTAWLRVETDFTRNFRADSPIVRSYEFVEDRLGGAGMWDVIVPAPKVLHWGYFKRVFYLEERLRHEVVLPGPEGESEPGLTKTLSLADAAVAASPVDLDNVPLGALRDVAVRRGMRELGSRMPVLLEALYGEDPQSPGRYYLRIMLRSRERQSSERKEAIIQQVRRISGEVFPETNETEGAEVTGIFVLLVSLIDSVLRDQWLTFGVATGVIALMMAVAFRSPLLALIALAPNTVPILAVMGLLGWAGLRINLGAAMIAAVSIGLAIDSSIHYLTGFVRERAAGRSVDEAVRRVQQTVGRAMVFSTLALIAGFAVLCTSPFIPTVYFGALVSLAMLGGLAGNLVVLPVLLKLLVRF